MERAVVVLSRLAITVAAWSASACSEPVGPACPADDVRRDGTVRPLCASAWELSRRSTARLSPDQAEVDAALALVMTAGQPLYGTLGHLPVARPWFGQPTLLYGQTTDPRLVGPWAEGTLRTGVEAVDGVIEQLGPISVRIENNGRGFEIRTHRAIATMNVQRALADVADLQILFEDHSVNAAEQDLADEGLDAADGGRVMRFQIGWVDCFVGCRFLHFWRTKVRSDGSVILVEEWGDPIPPDVLEAWSAPEP